MRSRKSAMDLEPPAMPIVSQTAGGGAVFGCGGLSVASFLEGVKAKPQGGTRGRSKLSDVEVAKKNAQRRANTGEWDGAGSAIIVGVYAMFHEIVYGEMPLELEQKPEFRRALGMAKALLGAFDDDAGAVVAFMKWSWKRQEGKIEWAKREGRDLSRFSYRFAMSMACVTDYRVQRKTR